MNTFLQDDIESKGAVVFDYTDLTSDPGELALTVHASQTFYLDMNIRKSYNLC